MLQNPHFISRKRIRVDSTCFSKNPFFVVYTLGAVSGKGRIQGESVVEARHKVQGKGLVNGEGVVWCKGWESQFGTQSKSVGRIRTSPERPCIEYELEFSRQNTLLFDYYHCVMHFNFKNPFYGWTVRYRTLLTR